LILVIDDEPVVRRVLELYLAGLGYRVIVAEGGAEGLALYRARGKEVALVILDVHMPRMSGPATLAALRQIDPGVRCWFMSGCAPADLREGPFSCDASELESDRSDAGAPQVLDKPFSLNRLEMLLRAALGTPGPIA
jgi:CheY-like chemotaxis protein